jgi:hypothetical protein
LRACPGLPASIAWLWLYMWCVSQSARVGFAWGVCSCRARGSIGLWEPPMARSRRSTVTWKQPSWRTGKKKAHVWLVRCHPKR